jgi:hypothetical protein
LKAGYEVTAGEPVEGYERHICVNDPFGNRLELLEYLSRLNTAKAVEPTLTE